MALLLSLTVHEAAHAWAADRLGDPTARALGRLSLNPAVHVDPLGTLVFPLVAMVTGAPLIGWAKPVPIAPWRFDRPRQASMLVAFAGPLSNLALAFVAAIACGCCRSRFFPRRAGWPGGCGRQPDPGSRRLAWGVLSINLLLAIFNLLPIPPLDGSSVLAGLLPERAAAGLDRLRPYGFLLLYALLLSGGFSLIVSPPYLLLLSWLT